MLEWSTLLDDYFSVDKFKIAYARLVEPLVTGVHGQKYILHVKLVHQSESGWVTKEE
jgi:hypothetical protein